MLVYLQLISTVEDQTKFTELYKTYQGLMFHVAKNILHNDQDAEDAVHQAFVNIAESIESIEPASSPRTKALLVLITEHRSLDIQRRRQHLLPHQAENLSGIEIEYLCENTLAYCMNKLPARYRIVLLLRHHYGYTPEETARFLGISKTNAIKLHQRAKARLELLCRKEGLL